jgi:hypothetical protein
MGLRAAAVLMCGIVMIASMASIFAEPETPDVCCSDPSVCGGKRCCDAESLGMWPCSEDVTGYCMTLCIRPTAGAEER